MFEAQLNQIRDGIAEFVLDRLKATGAAFWEALTDDQKTRIGEAVRDIPTLGFESILSGDEMGADLKAAVWTIGTDVSTAMLRAREQVDDPVVKAVFELVLSTMRGEEGTKSDETH